MTDRRRIATMLAWAILLVACGATSEVASGDGEPSDVAGDERATALPVDQVTVSAQVVFSEFDGPPIAVSATEVRAGQEHWLTHGLTLSGAQVEWNSAVELEAMTFEVDDSQLVPIEAALSLQRLHFGDSIEIEVAVGEFGVGLAVGSHSFELAIPVWLDSDEAFTGAQADGEVQVVLTYVVRDQDDGPPVFRSGGLTCLTDLFTDGTSDFADEDTGAPTRNDAIDDWWASQGSFFERDELSETVTENQASYEDEAGRVQLILSVTALGDGWVVSSYESCANVSSGE